MNPIIESYLVGLILGAGLGGLTAMPLFLHRTMVASLKESVLTDD